MHPYREIRRVPSALRTWSRVGAPVARVTSAPAASSTTWWACGGCRGPRRLEVVLGVDLHVGHAVDQAGHLAQHPAGGAARGAEGAGELQQRRPLPQLPADGGDELGAGPRDGRLAGPRVGRRGADRRTAWVPRKRPSVREPPQPERQRQHDGGDDDPGSGGHTRPTTCATELFHGTRPAGDGAGPGTDPGASLVAQWSAEQGVSA